jgi:hypothetical protein
MNVIMSINVPVYTENKQIFNIVACLGNPRDE